MKTLFAFPMLLILLTIGCTSQKQVRSGEKGSSATGFTGDTLKIVNEELEYEIIIFDPNFSRWFHMNARPRNYYSQSHLEARNREWVATWNIRSSNPLAHGGLYQMPINYSGSVDYGYEVNYMLYYYLTYFQLVNNVRLGSLPPRI